MKLNLHEKFIGSPFVKLNTRENFFCFSGLAKFLFLHLVLYQLKMFMSKIIYRVSQGGQRPLKTLKTLKNP